MVVVCWLAFVSTSFFEFAALLRVIACSEIIAYNCLLKNMAIQNAFGHLATGWHTLGIILAGLQLQLHNKDVIFVSLGSNYFTPRTDKSPFTWKSIHFLQNLAISKRSIQQPQYYLYGTINMPQKSRDFFWKINQLYPNFLYISNFSRIFGHRDTWRTNFQVEASSFILTHLLRSFPRSLWQNQYYIFRHWH